MKIFIPEKCEVRVGRSNFETCLNMESSNMVSEF